MAEKLTRAQAVTLKLISEGAVYQRNCGSAAWRIFGASPGVVGLLIQRKKLAHWSTEMSADGDYPALLTDLGRAVLTQTQDTHEE